jgi:hypothetical protein
MRNHLIGTNTILRVLILLVTLASIGAAQEPASRRRRQPPPQQEEPRIAELTPRELGIQAFGMGVPKECKLQAKLFEVIHDKADNFSPPGSPITLSPALSSYLASLNLPKPVQGYDEQGADRFFADSFRLPRPCRVCYATLEVRVRRAHSLSSNDSITVGGSPFTPVMPFRISSTAIWSPTDPAVKGLQIVLPTAALNSYLMSGNTPPLFLDVVAQDDTNFDYAKLSIWYY